MTANLIKAEFRKVLSTKVWWALLIPSAVLALVTNLGFTALESAAQSLPASTAHIPLGYLSLSSSFSFTNIFASIFGGLSMASEYRHRSITTTYLTGSRDGVYGAKLVVYAIFGLGYGVITLAAATLGVLIPGDSNSFPHAGDWLLISLIGTVVIALWTLLGVGIGGLISSPIAVVLALPLYGVIGEKLLGLIFSAAKAPAGLHYLPVQSSVDSVTSLSVQMFTDQLKLPPDSPAYDEIKNAFDAANLPPWWVAGLVFIGYTAVFCVLGWVVSRKRNIT